MTYRSMRALENQQIVELFEKHRVVSAIPSSTCCFCLHLKMIVTLSNYCASLTKEEDFSPILASSHQNMSSCLYSYFSTEHHQNPYLLVTITFQRLDSTP